MIYAKLHTPYYRYSIENYSLSFNVSGICSGLPIRVKMVEKRMKKLDYLVQELENPKLEGPEDAEITIVSWGSTINIIREAVLHLKEEGITANHLHLKYLNPFHDEVVTKILQKAKTTLCVEQNFTGQLRDYIRMKTGVNIKYKLLRWDGEPIVPSQIVAKVKEVLKNE